jgi:hypothetical protein
MSYEITPPTAATLNISPDGFRLWAKQYYECYRSFKRTSDFSPVPYFLLCRAIELQFKAFHIDAEFKNTGKSAVLTVKNKYRHHLINSYKTLPATRRTLSEDEFSLLQNANGIYNDKDKEGGFEYFSVKKLAPTSNLDPSARRFSCAFAKSWIIDEARRSPAYPRSGLFLK